MNKDVIISIKGIQSQGDADGEVIELITSGKYCLGDKGYMLSYSESDLTGLGGTNTTFEVEKGRITLTREGEMTSQIVFEEGRKHFSLYEVGEGAMTIGVSTSKVRSTLNDFGGDIEINYSVEIDHAMAGENLFQINVREVPPGGNRGRQLQ